MLEDLPAAELQYPPADPILSPLGRRQAAWLGEHLAQVGFKGPLFSSPYRRTLETAQTIAERTQCAIIPEPAIQEFGRPIQPSDGGQLTLREMVAYYPAVDPHVTLPNPWCINPGETRETEGQIHARVGAFLKRVMVMDIEEVLLVAHGATVHACIRLLVPDCVSESQSEVVPFNWNCALTSIRVDEQATASLIQLFEMSYMPPEYVTSNKVQYVQAKGD